MKAPQAVIGRQPLWDINKLMTPRRNSLVLLAAALLLAPALSHADSPDKKQKGSYLQMSGLAATIMRPDGRHGVMTVDAGIDVPDRTLRNYADTVQPRLMDAYAQTLQAYAGNLDPGRPPDADYLARRLQAVTDQVLGRPGARLLLGGVMLN
jgi:hypothetical protein